MSNIQSFIDGIDAVNARDWKRHRSLLAADVSYVDYGSGTSSTGADAFVETQRAGYEPFPDEQLRITAIGESGATVFAELVAEGTHTGALPLPTGGSMPATGKHFTVHVCVACDYGSDGLATSCRAYNNPMELMGQLGLMPEIPQQITLDAPAPAKT
jgi:predicted ester cyclase